LHQSKENDYQDSLLTEMRLLLSSANRELHPARTSKWILVVWLSACGMSSALSFAQSSQVQSAQSQSSQTPVNAMQEAPSAVPPAPIQPQRGSISGTVVDPDGALIANVKVTLVQPGAVATGAASSQETLSDGDGHFAFADVASGPFELSFAASGFAPLRKAGVLQAGENFDIPQIGLAIARNEVDVEVTLPQAQVAEDQVKVEEQQRLVGIFPNFYVSYLTNAAPLTTKLKFRLAWKTVIDPFTFVIMAGAAGFEQAEDSFSGYGQGAQGYAKRFGAAYANQVSGTFFGGAIFPSLFKQDPRYFVKGTGSKKSRLFYALATTVVCKGDNRHWQPNYSYVLGDLASGALSNLYYPAQNRNGVGLTFENAFIGIGAGAVGNVFEEFFSRKLTPHAPPQNPGKP
jgi:hypothetical protein